jgi:hypothetical protein
MAAQFDSPQCTDDGPRIVKRRAHRKRLVSARDAEVTAEKPNMGSSLLGQERRLGNDRHLFKGKK